MLASRSPGKALATSKAASQNASNPLLGLPPELLDYILRLSISGLDRETERPQIYGYRPDLVPDADSLRLMEVCCQFEDFLLPIFCALMWFSTTRRGSYLQPYMAASNFYRNAISDPQLCTYCRELEMATNEGKPSLKLSETFTVSEGLLILRRARLSLDNLVKVKISHYEPPPAAVISTFLYTLAPLSSLEELEYRDGWPSIRDMKPDLTRLCSGIDGFTKLRKLVLIDFHARSSSTASDSGTSEHEDESEERFLPCLWNAIDLNHLELVCCIDIAIASYARLLEHPRALRNVILRRPLDRRRIPMSGFWTHGDLHQLLAPHYASLHTLILDGPFLISPAADSNHEAATPFPSQLSHLELSTMSLAFPPAIAALYTRGVQELTLNCVQFVETHDYDPYSHYGAGGHDGRSEMLWLSDFARAHKDAGSSLKKIRLVWALGVDAFWDWDGKHPNIHSDWDSEYISPQSWPARKAHAEELYRDIGIEIEYQPCESFGDGTKPQVGWLSLVWLRGDRLEKFINWLEDPRNMFGDVGVV